MKPFKIREYLKNPNLRVVTREGKSVEILCTNLISDRPVVAKITELGFSLAYDVYGSHTSYQSPNDLFFVTEENKRWINLYRIKSGSDAYAGGLFKTKEEADNWIKNREAQERFEPTGFEAEPPQKAASIATGIWDENGDGGPKDTASFIKVVCSLLKTDEWSFYEQFVPEQYDSFEGSRTAIDDQDTWKVNHQDTLSKKTFWEILYDECLNDDKILNGMPLAEFKKAVEAHAQEIADEAWENYEPDESVDILVSRGHRD